MRWPVKQKRTDPEPCYIVQVTTPPGSKPAFCAGLVIEAGFCIAAAPILRACIGRSAPWIKGYLIYRGWRATIITAPLVDPHQVSLDV